MHKETFKHWQKYRSMHKKTNIKLEKNRGNMLFFPFWFKMRLNFQVYQVMAGQTSLHSSVLQQVTAGYTAKSISKVREKEQSIVSGTVFLCNIDEIKQTKKKHWDVTILKRS